MMTDEGGMIGRSDPLALLGVAVEAMRSAYASYSNFRVGAALLATDGTNHTGCNVENASYGLTICAERVAVSSAVAAGKRDFTALAIVSDGEAIPYPCGACRQVLAEFCGSGFPVYAACSERLDSFELFTLGKLLPHSFSLPCTSEPDASERTRLAQHRPR